MSNKQFISLVSIIGIFGLIQLYLFVDIADKLDHAAAFVRSNATETLSQDYYDNNSDNTSVSYSAPQNRAENPDISALKKIIEEEFQQLSTQLAAGASLGYAAPREKIQVSEFNQEHYSQTNNILDQAIARGTWNINDYEAILPLVKDLTQDQRTQLALKFADSINNQQIDFSAIDVAVLPPF